MSSINFKMSCQLVSKLRRDAFEANSLPRTRSKAKSKRRRITICETIINGPDEQTDLHKCGPGCNKVFFDYSQFEVHSGCFGFKRRNTGKPCIVIGRSGRAMIKFQCFLLLRKADMDTYGETDLIADISNSFDLFEETQRELPAICSEACNAARTTNLEVTANKLVQELRAFTGEVSFLKNEMTAFKGELGKVVSRVGAVEGRVGAVEEWKEKEAQPKLDKVDVLEDRLTTATKQIEQLQAKEQRREAASTVKAKLSFDHASYNSPIKSVSTAAIIPQSDKKLSAVKRPIEETVSASSGSVKKRRLTSQERKEGKCVTDFICKGSDSINWPLRFGNITDPKVSEQHRKMIEIIKGLPVWQGECYRAVDLLDVNPRLVNYLKSKKGSYSDQGWMSCSSVSFDDQETQQFKGRDTRFIIHSKTGRDISMFAKKNFENEHEIIFLPGTMFKVVRFAEEKDGDKVVRVVIELEEVDPSPLDIVHKNA